MESFRQEARLRAGAIALKQAFNGGATAEAEVLAGAERLLKGLGEDPPEVCAALCLRCRKVPEPVNDGRGGPSVTVVGKPLDVYVPLRLRLGQTAD
jgi:hypothetical protein